MSGGFGSSDQLSRRVTDLERKIRQMGGGGSAGSIVSLGTFSLDLSATSTNVTDANVSVASNILTIPTNDGALSLEGAIRTTAGSGSFSVSHASATFARTYAYVVVNPA